MLILKESDVAHVLEGREEQVTELVGGAYLAHGCGQSSLPHSVFLRFPEGPRDRIICLPAYVGGDEPAAGMKWVASFPGNREKGLPRASAVIILNSVETGFPEAILEGSLISARRTAASAALAARHLAGRRDSIGVVGAGLIAFETLRFITRTGTAARTVKVFDSDAARASEFVERCRRSLGLAGVETAGVLGEALQSDIVVFATTATTPHVNADAALKPGSTLLHVSLRDLAPELLLRHNNFVDDLDHANREQTSVHLASTLAGDTGFVRGDIADVLTGRVKSREAEEEVVIYSPFGLGVLDIALARMVLGEARRLGLGLEIPDFFSAA
jgi:ornithine cyclodeaminase